MEALNVVQAGNARDNRRDAGMTVTAAANGAAGKKRWTFTGLLTWYLGFAIPGLGMFSEAYIVFAVGQIKPFQKEVWPSCFSTYQDCDKDMVKHLEGYIQICGIIAGMLLWGLLADAVGRKLGSRMVATIMLSGVILLTFTPFAPGPNAYFSYFLVAQTWYGFGVGGEYPLASSSASERSAADMDMQHKRGQHVVLVFANQGVGNLVNIVVIIVSMAIFGQSGDTLTPEGSKHVIALMYGIGAIVALGMVTYRWLYLKESKLYEEEEEIEHSLATPLNFAAPRDRFFALYKSFLQYLPRQIVASGAWLANDFAFYGNKLQQGFFISLLYPNATVFKKAQWTLLNSFVGLVGYYFSAYFVDKPWFGRRVLQTQGFMWMFVLFIIIYGQWENMAVPGASVAGVHAFQALYYLSSFFNQFGPNCSTWLVAGEIFPTDVRATNHGLAAAMGKVGAIIASLWISYISDARKVFLISAMFGLGGAVLTILLLPDTTGLNLEENDRMQRCLLEGRWSSYHGEAVNPKHLSLFERFVLGWGKSYNPEQDEEDLRKEVEEALRQAMDPKHPNVGALHQLLRNQVVREKLPEEYAQLVGMSAQLSGASSFSNQIDEDGKETRV